MCLVTSIQHSCLAGIDNLSDKRSFRSIPFCQEQLVWNSMVKVKAKVEFCFSGIGTIFCPVHGKDGINQRSINSNKLSEMVVLTGEMSGCL